MKELEDLENIVGGSVPPLPGENYVEEMSLRESTERVIMIRVAIIVTFLSLVGAIVWNIMWVKPHDQMLEREFGDRPANIR